MQDRAAGICLVLMLKAPGRSKRRLAATIGPLAAAAADHLCECAFEDMAQWPGPVCFAPADVNDSAWLASRIGAAQRVVLQQGDNLGQRINHINRNLRAAGLERQIFIGIDCPELDARYLGQAAAALAEHDAVLGPARDGGVVLMGARHAWPDLGRLAWSSADLMTDLEQLCGAQGWRTARLEPLADVDTVEDLDALRRALADDPRPARRALNAWVSRERDRLRAAP